MKKGKSITMNIGITSFMIVFIILCLVVFSVLSLVSAHSNLRSTQTSVEHITSYYQISSQAEYVLKDIDDKLYHLYQKSLSKQDYFDNLDSIKLKNIQLKINHQDIEFEISDDKKTLQVRIEVLYPGDKLYEIKAWNTIVQDDIQEEI